MKYFFRKTLLFTVSFVILSYILHFFLDTSIKHSRYIPCKVWDEILHSNINSDILILGASKANRHLSPKVVDSVTHLKSCNLGMVGTGFNLQLSRFLLYLKYNKKPKYIIQDIACRGTLDNPISDIEQYIPYLHDPIIHKAVKDNNIFGDKDFYIPLYKYTHTRTTKMMILDGALNCLKNTYGPGIKENYAPPKEPWDQTFWSFKKQNIQGIRSEIDPLSKANFDFFLEYCKAEKIKVIFVYSPEYFELQKMVTNRDSIISIFKNYATKYNIPFLNYSNNSICFDTLNFVNSLHMNIVGVNKFSPILANDLKKIIH